MADIEVPLPERKNADELTTDGDNPNEMKPEEFEALQDNIKKYGLHLPIITDADLVVADGEHRLEAAKELGLEEVPVVALDVDEVDRKILRQVHNKLSGAHDPDQDLEEYQRIREHNRVDELENLLGHEENTVETLLENQSRITEDEYDEERAKDDAEEDHAVEQGQLWELGPHRLLVADATDPDAYKRLLHSDEEVNLVFSDPPYGVSYDQSTNVGATEAKFDTIENDDLRDNELQQFLTDAWQAHQSHTADPCSYYICSPSNKQAYNILRSLERNDIHIPTQIIWAKNHFNLGRNDYHWKHESIWYGWKADEETRYWQGTRKENTVWEIPRPNHDDYMHPTQKPIALPARAIKNSTKAHDIVLDPFTGSGSTLIATQQQREHYKDTGTLLACQQTGRRARLVEISPDYANVVIKRWNDYVDEHDLPGHYKAQKSEGE